MDDFVLSIQLGIFSLFFVSDETADSSDDLIEIEGKLAAA